MEPRLEFFGSEASRLRRCLLERGAQYIVKSPGGIRLKSGRVSDFYIDFKGLFCNDPELARLLVSELYYDMAGEIKGGAAHLQAAGCGYSGASILGLLVGMHPDVYPILIREKPKDHGMKGVLTAPRSLNAPVGVVDDVLTSGGTVRHVVRVLREKGMEPAGIFVIFRREKVGDIDGVPVRSLFDVIG